MADYSINLLDANLETLAVLGSAIAKRDADIDAHNYRVSLCAVRLGEKIVLGAEDMCGLIKGSFIHDVGKIEIPDAILLKPGRLTDEEYCEQGRGVHFDPKLLDAFAVIAPGLHEKYAGHEGDGLRQELVAVVDRYFSAGMESLSYGGADASAGTAKRLMPATPAESINRKRNYVHIGMKKKGVT